MTDVDGDDHLDFVLGRSSGNDLAWWKNNGSQCFTEYPLSLTAPQRVDAVRIADLDGDDDRDIDAAYYNPSRLTWWRNNGSPSFSEEVIVNPVATPIAERLSISLIDKDGDDDRDIFFSSRAESSSNTLVGWGINLGDDL
jgi:hypothetical protein